MITIRLLLENIFSHQEQAINNCIKENGVHFIDKMQDLIKTPQFALFYAFDWDDSPEGYDFWHSIMKQSSSLPLEIPLPPIIDSENPKKPKKQKTISFDFSQKEFIALVSIIEGAMSIDLEQGEEEGEEKYYKARVKEYKIVKKAFRKNGFEILDTLKI